MVVPLSQIDVGEWVSVVWVGSEKSMATRLQDLGFSPQEKICCILKGKPGGMRAYLVRNAVIGLRENNISEIFVQTQSTDSCQIPD